MAKVKCTFSFFNFLLLYIRSFKKYIYMVFQYLKFICWLSSWILVLKCLWSVRNFNTCSLFSYFGICTHCNPLQGNYRVELLHREIRVIITGDEFAEYNFLLFWLYFIPCFNSIEIITLVLVMCTGSCKVILQGLEGCFDSL